MEGLICDLRTATRSLRRRSGLTAAVIASLALGLGATTAVFSVARAVLWSSLPVREPDRLVLLQWAGETWPQGLGHSGIGIVPPPGSAVASRSLPYPWFLQIRDRQPRVADVLAFAPLGTERQHLTFAARGAVQRIAGEMVSGNYFDTLGVAAHTGRLLTVDDERMGARVAVISHEFWRSRFASDPSVPGQRVTINQVPFTVVGVAAPGFLGLQPGWAPALWVPVLDDPRVTPWNHGPPDGVRGASAYWWVQVMARIASGTTGEHAHATLDASFQRYVLEALPAVDRARLPHLLFEPGGSGLDRLRQLYERPLRLLLFMAGVVLLVASANVALLLLSRGLARRREFALRLSLGAPRRRLVRQLLLESALMAGAGGFLGAIAAAWTSYALVVLAPADRRPVIETPLDAETFLFAGLIALFAALIAGVIPAFVATRVDLMPAVREPGAGGSAREPAAHSAWSSAFIIAQLALSLSLLVAAGLLIRSVLNLQGQSIGIDDERLLVAGVDVSGARRADGEIAEVHARLLRGVGALSGVESVTATRLPLLSGWISTIRLTRSDAADPPISVQAFEVGSDFARTVGLRLIAGQDLHPADVDGRRPALLLSETAALRLFGTVQIAGREVLAGPSGAAFVPYEIAGVVGNLKDSDLRAPVGPAAAFVPYTAASSVPRAMYFYIRTAGNPATMAEPVSEAVRRVDRDLAIFEMEAMASQVGAALWRERLLARLLAVFGALALALACIGLYGTLSHAVGRRRGEMAIRLALGARRTHLEWLVLRRALTLVAAGLAVGAVIIAAGSRWISPWLFGVTPLDPLTIAGSAGILAIVGLLAASLPSRAASSVDPAITLREE